MPGRSICIEIERLVSKSNLGAYEEDIAESRLLNMGGTAEFGWTVLICHFPGFPESHDTTYEIRVPCMCYASGCNHSFASVTLV